MKCAIALCVACLLCASSICLSAVPQTMSYQGVLRDASGVPVLDGVYDLTFRLHDAATGGTALWSETRMIEVSDGIFSIVLGAFTGIDLPFDAQYWLGISVSGDPELSPRTRLTSAPYAYRSAVAESLAGGVGADGDWEISGDDIYRLEGAVGIGTATPGVSLDVDGTARVTSFIMPTGASAGHVLTSDVDGTGTWQENTGTGGIGGSGTEGWLPKFTGPTTLGNSVIYEDAEGRVGIGAGTNLSNALRVYTSDPAGHDCVEITNSGALGSGLDLLELNTGFGSADDCQFIECVNGSGIRFTVNGDGAIYSRMGADINAAVDISDEFGTSPVLKVRTTDSGALDITGVYGRSVPSSGYGTGGYFEGGEAGVFGAVYNADGSFCYGTYGACEGGATYNCGVYGYAQSGGYNYGIYGSAFIVPHSYAGYFNGDVHVGGSLSGGKGVSKIDHPLDPENMYLNQAFVESPEMKSVHDGVATLDGSGEVWVELPNWFEALNCDFRYQLTCIGGFAPVYVAERISGNTFKIAGGQPGMEVSWQVTGIRHDPFSETYGLEVEEEKDARERGKYLHPTAYGLPQELSVSHEVGRELAERKKAEAMRVSER